MMDEQTDELATRISCCTKYAYANHDQRSSSG
jgi:hypothetical protein